MNQRERQRQRERERREGEGRRRRRKEEEGRNSLLINANLSHDDDSFLPVTRRREGGYTDGGISRDLSNNGSFNAARAINFYNALSGRREVTR